MKIRTIKWKITIDLSKCFEVRIKQWSVCEVRIKQIFHFQRVGENFEDFGRPT